jgi:hypothetical protein
MDTKAMIKLIEWSLVIYFRIKKIVSFFVIEFEVGI